MDEQMSREDPGASPKKHRGPQGRDIMAARMAAQGLPMGSGRTYARMTYVARKVQALQAEGREQEALLLSQALDTSARGAEQLARLPDDIFSLLCQGVLTGEAQSLLEALRTVSKSFLAEEGSLTMTPAKNGLYRLISQHNSSSILVSVEDLFDVADYIQEHRAELEAHRDEG